MIKVLIATIVLYFLTVVQISFLPHFSLWNRVPSVVLAFIIVWNLLEDCDRKFGFFVGIVGGFFLDLFSEGLIGFHVSLILFLCILIKFVIKKHVRIPFAQEI